MHLQRMLAIAAIVVGTAGGACSKKADKPGTALEGPAADLDSKDILARTEVADRVDVKHVLISWKDLAAAYGGQIDPRAANRSGAEAARLAREVADKLRARPDSIDALVKEHSEDPGSLRGTPYTVEAKTDFVPEFKALALRLGPSEVGIVRTDFGYHVMVRVPPPPPDPIESADVLARPAGPGPVWVQHVLMSWKDAPAAAMRPLDQRAQNRTKAEADALAQDTLAKVRGGADMKALIKERSEDGGSKDNARTYEVTPAAALVEPFKALALRLELGEAGMVKTDFGWHVMKRVAQPPPDPLESSDILARAPTTETAKVKHIVLGWIDAHADDPRGAARTRKELDALVKATLARLAKGEKFDALMAELSEDPGSAKSARAFTVDANPRVPRGIRDLAWRLKVDEVGVVGGDYGLHLIQRVE